MHIFLEEASFFYALGLTTTMDDHGHFQFRWWKQDEGLSTHYSLSKPADTNPGDSY